MPRIPRIWRCRFRLPSTSTSACACPRRSKPEPTGRTRRLSINPPPDALHGTLGGPRRSPSAGGQPPRAAVDGLTTTTLGLHYTAVEPVAPGASNRPPGVATPRRLHVDGLLFERPVELYAQRSLIPIDACAVQGHVFASPVPRLSSIYLSTGLMTLPGLPVGPVPCAAGANTQGPDRWMRKSRGVGRRRREKHARFRG